MKFKKRDDKVNPNKPLNITWLNYTLLLITLLILAVNSISAAEIETKTEFAEGETMIAVASGNFLDQITANKIHFYKDHEEIPMEYDVGKINNEFYIYALLVGKTPGNYSVKIKGVRYMNGTIETDADIVKNFTITNEMASFSVKPGFVKTQDDFYLEMQNLLSSRITVNIEPPKEISSLKSLELLSGEIKRVAFSLQTENQIFDDIELSSGNIEYFVPVFVEGLEVQGAEGETRSFRFEPGEVSVSMATNSDSRKIIYLLNTGTLDLENISFFVSPALQPYVEILPERIGSLSPDSARKIEILLSSGSSELQVEGEITATAENLTTSFTLLLDFTENYIPSEEETEILTTCSQINGTVCTSEQKCGGDSIDTTNGICCLGTCEQKSKTSSTGKIIGWSIVALVIILLLWFFRKYKRARPKIDLLKVAQGKK